MATHTAYSQLFIVYFCHLQDISTQVVRRKRTIGRTSTLLPPTFSSKSSSVSDKLPPSSFGTLESNLDIPRPQSGQRHPDLQTRHGLLPTCSVHFFHLKNYINSQRKRASRACALRADGTSHTVPPLGTPWTNPTPWIRPRRLPGESSQLPSDY